MGKLLGYPGNKLSVQLDTCRSQMPDRFPVSDLLLAFSILAMTQMLPAMGALLLMGGELS